MNAVLITCSLALSKIPYLSRFLQQNVSYCPMPFLVMPSRVSGIVTWGQKATGKCAKQLADRHQLPLIYLEDGFLRSFGLGVLGDAPLSLIVDPLGSYYDARQPSTLENLLNHAQFSDEQITQGEKALNLLKTEGLSKYNQGKPVPANLFADNETHILLVDQTKGDASVSCGLANDQSFEDMLTTAQKNHPNAHIWIKTHPDVLAGKKQGYFNPLHLDQTTHNTNIHWLTEDYHPHSLLVHFDHVYVVTSQLGLDALIVGKPVTCFGLPFYAGWGLTQDKQHTPRRQKQRTLIELITAAYLLYPRYLHPTTHEISDFFTVATFIAHQKQAQLWWYNAHRRTWSGRIFCVGMKYWRRALIRPFFGKHNQVIFVANDQQAKQQGIRSDDHLVVWGRRDTPELRALANTLDIPLIHVEDGFLRSVGLGADLIPPLSLVFDTRGIYFDPTQPSDLEHLLNHCQPLSAETNELISQVKQQIIQHRLTKYNVEDDRIITLDTQGKHIILVPGQVEDDASIRYGSPRIATNMALLSTVRMANPSAFIIYKPHPDVLGHNRVGGLSIKALQPYCNHIETHASAIACIEAVDEVHTMTSLIGFDALLRGKKVVTYGSPFYAGWGLTEDQQVIERRNQQTLTLEQLIAMTLRYYPRYYDPDANGFTSLKDHIERLIEIRQTTPPYKLNSISRYLRKAIAFLTNIWLSWRISR